MNTIINLKTHILLIELATRTHSYLMSPIECDIFIQMCHATHNEKLSQQYDEKTHKPGCIATEDS